MAKALYRKYRPQTFSDVVGQSAISRILSRQVESGTPTHAYLFTGSRGTGKTSCAKILAKAVNCEHPDHGDPCNTCDTCRGIDDGSVLDILEIDAASNNGVDDVRELRSDANFVPTSGKYRVYIIDEVHMLSISAFNALLKLLEEPPAHSIFILATTEVHKIPATILSRCQRYDFRRIEAVDIIGRINYIAAEEGFTVTEGAAALIARLADGAMRDALSILDLCRADTNEITEPAVALAAGLCNSSHLFDIFDMLSCGKGSELLMLTGELYHAGVDMRQLCNELCNHSRNLMLIKTLKEPEKLIVEPTETIAKLRVQAQSLELSRIFDYMSAFEDTALKIGRGTAGYSSVELMFIRLCAPAQSDSVEGLRTRIEALERALVSQDGQIAAPQSAKPEPAPKPEPEPVQQPEPASAEQMPTAQPDIIIDEPAEEPPAQPPEEQSAPPAEEPVIAEQPESSAPPTPPEPTETGEPQKLQVWHEVMQALMPINPMMYAVLDGSAAYVDGEYLLIDTDNPHFREMVKEGKRHRDTIRTAVMQVTGRLYKLGPYKRAQAEMPAETDPLDDFVDNNRFVKIIND